MILGFTSAIRVISLSWPEGRNMSFLSSPSVSTARLLPPTKITRSASAATFRASSASLRAVSSLACASFSSSSGVRFRNLSVQLYCSGSYPLTYMISALSPIFFVSPSSGVISYRAFTPAPRPPDAIFCVALAPITAITGLSFSFKGRTPSFFSRTIDLMATSYATFCCAG